MRCVVFTLAIFLAYVHCKPSIGDHHKLLLLCFDALKWSYRDHMLDMASIRHLDRNGVRAKYMKPSAVPTFTSPSFTTLATGLYTESHGVIHNSYFDVRYNSTTHLTFADTLSINEWFDNGQEPIWITARKQGLKSGGHSYPGADLVYRGLSAHKAIKGKKVIVDEDENLWVERVDTIVKWFTEDNLEFVAVYFGQPDELSHINGPQSTEVLDVVLPRVDRTLKYLIKKINENDLTDDLNIILASDHGMSDVKPSSSGEEAICYMKYLDPEWLKFEYAFGPYGLIEPKPMYREKVYGILKGMTKHMDVYYKEDLPERFHLKNNDRVTSIVMLAHTGYSIYSYEPDRFIKGDHGYDNENEDMRTMFYLLGPSFKKGEVIEGFESVNVYPLMCYLLGLIPAPNNGSLNVLFPTLMEEQTQTTSVLIMAVLVAVFFCRCVFSVLAVKEEREISLLLKIFEDIIRPC